MFTNISRKDIGVVECELIPHRFDHSCGGVDSSVYFILGNLLASPVRSWEMR